MVVLWLLIIWNVFPCTWTRPTGDKYTVSTEYVEIEKVSGTIYRHKRSATIIFPNTVRFRFQMEAGEVTLNLERTSHNHQATHVPIYTLEETEIKYWNHTVKESFALYQDIGLGGSVLLKVPPGDQLPDYELTGAFSYQGNNYEITPLDDAIRRKRDTSTHTVQRQALPYGNFYDDELVPPPDSAGFNMPKYYQPPFPAESLRQDHQPPLIPLKEDLSDDAGADFLPATIRYSGDVDYLLPPGMNRFQNEPVRQRRESESIYIEYMVISDYRNTENWKSRVGGETDDEKLNNAYDAMYQYYQFVVNGIDVRFRSATSSRPTIRVVFASLLVSTSASTSPWITKNKLSADSVDDAGCLLDFALWKKATYSMLPRHDHAALFTGFDLATRSSRSTLGMAYLNSMCSEAWSVSENEETYNAVAIHIAGHELGHNIGSRHDGSGNGCSSNSLYLMAGRLPQVYNGDLAPNPWKFSTCSQLSIQSFIGTLGQSNCLQNEPDISSGNHITAGHVYSADEQCNMTYGNDAVLCRENLFYQWDTMCYAMQCKEKGQSSCIGRIFPFDGTPCGNKKWCQGGLCIYSEDAPVTHETCVFGDDPHSECDTETACSESNYYSRESTCCATCLLTTTTQGPSSSTSPASFSTKTSSSTLSTPIVTEESTTLNYSASSSTDTFTSKVPITTTPTTQYSTSTITTQASASTVPTSGNITHNVTDFSTEGQTSKFTVPSSPRTPTAFTKQSTKEPASTNTKPSTNSFTVSSTSSTTSLVINTTLPYSTQETSPSDTISSSTSPKDSTASSKTLSSGSSSPYSESSTTSTDIEGSTFSSLQTSSTQSQISTQQVSIPSTLTSLFTQTFQTRELTSTTIQHTTFTNNSTNNTNQMTSVFSSQTPTVPSTSSSSYYTNQNITMSSSTTNSTQFATTDPSSSTTLKTTSFSSSIPSTLKRSTLISTTSSIPTETVSLFTSKSNILSSLSTQSVSKHVTTQLSSSSISSETDSSSISTPHSLTNSTKKQLSSQSTLPEFSSSQYTSTKSPVPSSYTSSTSPPITLSSTSVSPITSNQETTTMTAHETSPDQETTHSPITSSTPLSSTMSVGRTTAREKNEELSYELQTMISLFLTAAIVI